MDRDARVRVGQGGLCEPHSVHQRAREGDDHAPASPWGEIGCCSPQPRDAPAGEQSAKKAHRGCLYGLLRVPREAYDGDVVGASAAAVGHAVMAARGGESPAMPGVRGGSWGADGLSSGAAAGVGGPGADGQWGRGPDEPDEH